MLPCRLRGSFWCGEKDFSLSSLNENEIIYIISLYYYTFGLHIFDTSTILITFYKIHNCNFLNLLKNSVTFYPHDLGKNFITGWISQMSIWY